jgi:hypothetical protein
MFWRRRAIFKFRDGRRRRRADPLAVWRRLWTDAEVNLERDLQDAFDPDLPDTESLAAMKNLADLTRRAFALPTFEQGGLTEVECQNLLADFLTYMASVKKKVQPAADAVATYGLAILGRRISYEVQVGLILNAPRVERRRAFRFLEAGMSLLGGELGKEWFDAIAQDDAEADAMHNSYKSRKAAYRNLEGIH